MIKPPPNTELVREIASWFGDNGNTALHDDLHTAADTIDNVHTDQDRIEQLARLFGDTYGASLGATSWNGTGDRRRDAIRDGIRAVLHRIGQETVA